MGSKSIGLDLKFSQVNENEKTPSAGGNITNHNVDQRSVKRVFGDILLQKSLLSRSEKEKHAADHNVEAADEHNAHL